MDARVWYVTYGSNTALRLLERYLDPGHRESHSLVVPHALWFGGHSHRWDGGVAYLDPSPAPPGEGALARAYRSSITEVLSVAAGENVDGDARLTAVDVDALPPGGWMPLPVTTQGDPRRGKYNALLRLPDIEDAPAFTLTTWRSLAQRPPGEEYVHAVRAGLAEAGFDERAVTAHLATASVRRPHRPPAWSLPYRWRVTPRPHQRCPRQTVALPARFAELTGDRAQATIIDGAGRRRTVQVETTAEVHDAAAPWIDAWTEPGRDRSAAVIELTVGEGLRSD